MEQQQAQVAQPQLTDEQRRMIAEAVTRAKIGANLITTFAVPPRKMTMATWLGASTMLHSVEFLKNVRVPHTAQWAWWRRTKMPAGHPQAGGLDADGRETIEAQARRLQYVWHLRERALQAPPTKH